MAVRDGVCGVYVCIYLEIEYEEDRHREAAATERVGEREMYTNRRYQKYTLKCVFVVVLFLIVLCYTNSTSVISWLFYDVGNKENKARAYTFTDSEDL